MRKKLLMGAAAIAVAAGMNMVTVGTAQANAAAFFKCTFAEGATMDQLVEATAAFVATVKENGYEGYSVRFLSPVFSSDISPGTFWWVGVGPSLEVIGAINDYWTSDANKEHRDRFGERAVGIQQHPLMAESATVLFQLRKQAWPEPNPAKGFTDPHALDFTNPVFEGAKPSAGNCGSVAMHDDEDPGGGFVLGRFFCDGVARVEAFVEAEIELAEVLGDRPSGFARAWVHDIEGRRG